MYINSSAIFRFSAQVVSHVPFHSDQGGQYEYTWRVSLAETPPCALTHASCMPGQRDGDRCCGSLRRTWRAYYCSVLLSSGSGMCSTSSTARTCKVPRNRQKWKALSRTASTNSLEAVSQGTAHYHPLLSTPFYLHARAPPALSLITRSPAIWWRFNQNT